MIAKPTTNELIDLATDRVLTIFGRAGVPVEIPQAYIGDASDLIVLPTDVVCVALMITREVKPSWYGDHIQQAHDAFHALQMATYTRFGAEPSDLVRVAIRREIKRLIGVLAEADANLTRAIAERG
ncbi:hypothetical protein [Nonomuraea maritima]|uniref:hypothetical protein n=1 Tax=Nonomuraea maritima TaxID=683260 RepID=UPI003718FC36